MSECDVKCDGIGIRDSGDGGAHARQPQTPKSPHYRSHESRLGTFNDRWPHQSPSSSAVADAGFFSPGANQCSDMVECFFCGGRLQNWQPFDDPWLEHHRNYPRCAYLSQPQAQEVLRSIGATYGTASGQTVDLKKSVSTSQT